jgi:peptidoglycan/xylan/chitin deacetylase (PgdA/CDA1 family)
MLAGAKYSIARLTGIPWLTNQLNRRHLLVLSYHGIHDCSHPQHALPQTFVSVTDLAQQLQAVRHRYHIIDAHALRASLSDGKILPPQSALITFDDGYESFWRLAQPVLESMSIRAVVFVSTRFVEENAPFWFDLAWYLVMTCESGRATDLAVDLGLKDSRGERKTLAMQALGALKTMTPTKRDVIIKRMIENRDAKTHSSEKSLQLFLPMTKDQIRTLSARGVSFGGHTHSHTILSVLPQDQAEAEIVLNKKVLESITEKPCDFFAYPNGGPGDYHDVHKKLLKIHGFTAAFTLEQGRTHPRKDPMAISRLNVAPEDTSESLLFRCSGITPIQNRFRSVLSISSRPS